MLNKRRFLRGLFVIGLLAGVSISIVFDLPLLIHLNQVLKVGLSWDQVTQYFESEMHGMTIAEVHAKLTAIDSKAEIGDLTSKLTGRPCQIVQMFKELDFRQKKT